MLPSGPNWVSCHSDTPMWRYATLPVVIKMYRKLFFNNKYSLEYQNSFYNFSSGVSTDAMCNFLCALVKRPEEFETGYVPHFVTLQTKKNIDGMGVAYFSWLSSIEGTSGSSWLCQIVCESYLSKHVCPDYSGTCRWTHFNFSLWSTGTNLYRLHE